MVRFGRRFSILACWAALSLTGCRNNYEMPLPQSPPVAVINSNLRIALQLSPRLVRQMDPVTLTVRLSNAHGEPVKGASVRADLVMPAMDMGKNALTLMPTAKGVYTGTDRFTMDGDWQVTITAAKGQEKAVQSFPVTVR
jgi:nitrogen fixation protein FixH